MPKTQNIIASPIAPQLKQSLDTWQGLLSANLELQDCTVTDQDFSNTKGLLVEDCELRNSLATGAKFEKLAATDAIFSRFEGEQLIQIAPLLATELGFKLTSSEVQWLYD